MNVSNVDSVTDRSQAEVIRLADCGATFHTPASHPQAQRVTVVITAGNLVTDDAIAEAASVAGDAGCIRHRPTNGLFTLRRLYPSEGWF